MRRIGLLVSSVGSVSQIRCTWSFDYREDSVQYGRVCDRHFSFGDDVQEMSSLYRSHGSDGFLGNFTRCDSGSLLPEPSHAVIRGFETDKTDIFNCSC